MVPGGARARGSRRGVQHPGRCPAHAEARDPRDAVSAVVRV